MSGDSSGAPRQRVVGFNVTTKKVPLARFDQIEREALPLPATPYAVATWKQAKLHPDCHVVFEHAFYSAPHRLSRQKLWLGNTSWTGWLRTPPCDRCTRAQERRSSAAFVQPPAEEHVTVGTCSRRNFASLLVGVDLPLFVMLGWWLVTRDH
jgi:hypothetical protein